MESQECVTPESKVCTTCGVRKQMSDFYKKGLGKTFSSCKECTKEADRLRYKRSKEKVLARCAEYRANNKAKIKSYMADYYVKNRDDVLSRCYEYRSDPQVRERELQRQRLYYAERSAEIQAKRKKILEENPERKARYVEYHKKHYVENKHAYIAKHNKRRAKKHSATPAWANLESIKQIYKQARFLSEQTGVKHHVDHVVPLQGKSVSGLHVENNLQIIPARQNLSKANKLEG